MTLYFPSYLEAFRMKVENYKYNLLDLEDKPNKKLYFIFGARGFII